MIRLDGADLSHHQDDAGPIDWPALRAATWWIATKATQSTQYVDPTFNAHWAQMAAQGFTHRGLYHWLSHTTDPAAQAAHFLTCVGTLHVGEFCMLDAEEAGITAAQVLAWLRAVEAVTHRPCAVYTGAYVAGGTIWQTAEIRNSVYGPRPMHLAAYTTEAKAKALPGVAANPWSAWQWSSNGPVPGVVGRCDMNRVDIVAHFDLAAGISNPQPEVDDVLRLLVPTDDAAQFFAMCTPQGAALRCEWTGDLNRIAFYRNAHPAGATPFEMALTRAAFVNVSLDGPRPPGWEPELFGNPDEIRRRENPGVDDDARLTRLETVTTQLNDSVGRLGQSVGDIQTGLIKAGGG